MSEVYHQRVKVNISKMINIDAKLIATVTIATLFAISILLYHSIVYFPLFYEQIFMTITTYVILQVQIHSKSFISGEGN